MAVIQLTQGGSSAIQQGAWLLENKGEIAMWKSLKREKDFFLKIKANDTFLAIFK